MQLKANIQKNKEKLESKDSEKISSVKTSPIDQWVGLNLVLKHHKIVNFGLMSLSALLVLVVLFLSMQNPVVAVLSEKNRVILKGSRQTISIGAPEIEDVVKEFIKIRYEWNQIEPKSIADRLSHLTTSGLNRKIKVLLTDLKEKHLQGKKASQAVAGVFVKVTEKEVTAYFDKVLKIEGIPLVIPTGVSIAVTRGSQTSANPSGIYINGIIENSGK